MKASNEQRVILGGGCFWCIEAAMQKIPGVLSVVSGYAGGHLPSPDYRSVCSGDTGHAEVVAVSYNSDKVSLAKLLAVFFAVHDPTSLNRQGNDVGTQYRSFIGFQATDEMVIRNAIKQVQKSFDRPIVTELQPDPVFYPAEAEHQDYYNQHSYQPYCQLVIAPKLAKLNKLLSESGD